MSDTAKHLQELQEAEASLKAAFENYRTAALRASASLPAKPQHPPSEAEADGATPGPWEAHQQDRVLTGPYAEEHACWYITGYDGTDDGVCIASLDSGYTGAQTEANAHLLAAARTLRSALRPFAALSTDDVVELGLEQAVLDARAAIASSEGK